MEVVVPVSAADFNFDSARSAACSSAPSTPRRFGDLCYFSVPSSPSRSAAIYSQFDPFSSDAAPPSELDAAQIDDDADFAFDFGGHLDASALAAAEELFEAGKIRPLQPPPSAAPPAEQRRGLESAGRERGRERSGSRRTTRSLSPYRVSDLVHETAGTGGGVPPPCSPKVEAGKKWSIKDFLLFRSASEGRAASKDPLRKYSAAVAKVKAEDGKSSSFRLEGGGVSARRGRISAHELHYAENRAAAEEMKRKTFLPYRPGLLGFLGFQPSRR